jgi:ABC-2 type transport system ATP-binding protein
MTVAASLSIRLDHVSRWYGNVVAVNDISFEVGAGITGLLGPNGAGKSTLLHMIAGLLEPSAGAVTVDGRPTWRHPDMYRRVGLVPEREAVYPYLSGREFVALNAHLHDLDDPAAAIKRALERVELSTEADRRVGTYSKGMRQRIKLAGALVHDPPVLVLDEPFNGMDPRQRLQLIDLLATMGEQGRTVLFSSHILEEVEQLAGGIQVMVAGRHAASGDFREIRRLMTERPHQYVVHSSDDRALASAVIADGSTSGVDLGGTAAVGLAPAGGLQVQATDYARFIRMLPRLAAGRGIRLFSVTPADESLESVFSYLVDR